MTGLAVIASALVLGVAPGAHDAPRQLQAACPQQAAWVAYKFTNRFGTRLWSYYEQVYWCVDQGAVSYFYRYRWAKTSSVVPLAYYAPWTFEGNVESGFDCPNEHCYVAGLRAAKRTAVTKGYFRTCAVPWINFGCNNVYPVLAITVYGDGSPPTRTAGA